MDESEVEEVMRRVLLSGRLNSGTKLGEAKLASIFGVSRERVRGVLKRLSHDRMVQIEKNRGAFVLPVDLSDARATYEARRILESGIVIRLVECIAPADITRLQQHLAKEIRLKGAHDRAAMVRLAGEFHLLMAQMVGNEMILRQLQELIGCSTALVTFFEPESAATCTCEEHGLVLEAVAKRDSAAAVRAMTSHLSLIETRLRPRICESLGISPETAITEELQLFHAERVLARQAS